MENINLKPGWEMLYNLNFPAPPPDISGVSGLTTNSVVPSSTPTVTTNTHQGTSWRIGKKILLIGGLCFLIYFLYRGYKSEREKEV